LGARQAWFPQGLDHFISFPLNFLTSSLGFCILGALVGFRSFVKLFVAEVHHKDLEMISSFFMLADH
jgi:hypothetical protein